MADKVRTIIKKEWFKAEELDKVRRGEEHENEDIGTVLEGTGPRLESLQILSSCFE